MCGIVGITFPSVNQREKILEQVVSLKHRGPDGTGTFVNQSISLGMVRLAINTIEIGNQPAFSPSGDIVVIFNGEIYNFQELARSIGKDGNELFSEAQVIARLYEQQGEAFIERLDGFFAIAIWDKRDESLLLARDRFGKKPLFYGKYAESLYFASEVKAMFCGGFPRVANLSRIQEVLQFGFVNAPNTAYQDIFQVLPGSYMKFTKNGKCHETKYWQLAAAESLENFTFDEAKEELKSLLKASVKKRLMAERPIGLFLSGGIDSTLIACLLSEMGIYETFTLGFHESDFDESTFAIRVAKALGLPINVQILEPDPTFFHNEYSRIIDHPYADSSFLPTFFLSKFASSKVKVAFSGDGGDEGFGGYKRYSTNLKLSKLALPSSALSRLPDVLFRSRLQTKLYRSLKELTDSSRYEAMTTLQTKQQSMKFLTQALKETSIPRLPYNKNQSESLLQSMQNSDVQSYLPGDLLFKMDMASMGNGLEVRSPFLDASVFQFGFSQPDEFKIRGSKKKLLPSAILEDYLPKELFLRPKQGFAIPRAQWLRNELKDMAHDLLLGSTSRQRGWFIQSEIQSALKRHQAGWDLDEVLWPLLMTELWARNWID
jgi:asparagine synthase (glutamine-hydrolysing)